MRMAGLLRFISDRFAGRACRNQGVPCPRRALATPLCGTLALSSMLLLPFAGGGTEGGAAAGTNRIAAIVLSANPPGETNPTPLRFKGADARRQLVVTSRLTNGACLDLTRHVTYTTAPDNVVRVDKDGLVVPIANGNATINAATAEGLSASLAVTVENLKRLSRSTLRTKSFPSLRRRAATAAAATANPPGKTAFACRCSALSRRKITSISSRNRAHAGFFPRPRNTVSCCSKAPPRFPWRRQTARRRLGRLPADRPLDCARHALRQA
jgi:hypothetical protein